MANEVFISYSRKDYKKVSRIKKEIDSKVGINCWMDLDGIESGDVFHRNITSAINRHDTVLFMLSKNSMNSDWALKELSYAENKQKRVILVNIDNSKLNDDFLFNFNTKNNIIWSNSLQHDQLIRNLRSWHCNYSQNNSITHDNSSSFKSLFSDNLLLGIIVFASCLLYGFFKVTEQGGGLFNYLLIYLHGTSLIYTIVVFIYVKKHKFYTSDEKRSRFFIWVLLIDLPLFEINEFFQVKWLYWFNMFFL